MKIPHNQKTNGEAAKGTTPGVITLLNRLLEAHAIRRTNGNVASHSTTTTLGQVLRTCFRDLKELGYRLEDPANLGEKHIEALANYWHKEQKAMSTIQSRMSALRIFGRWIGKNGMVKDLPKYLPHVPKKELVVKKVAVASKGWSEKQVDIIEKIQMADEIDKEFGLMIRAELAFGLRRIEVLQLKPWKSDKGDKLAVYEAKNGRPRDVYIVTQEQRAILDLIKENVKKTESMGWKSTRRGKTATLEYCVGRYNKSMAEIGITKEEAGTTGHGLRAQFAENMALIMEMIPPTLGGTSGQMCKDDLYVKRAQISELLGHTRTSITASYYGSYKRNAPQDEADRSKKHIEKAIRTLYEASLNQVKEERKDQCLQLQTELKTIGVEATLAQVQYLWKIHSLRYGSKWINPVNGNVIAIEVAAINISKETK